MQQWLARAEVDRQTIDILIAHADSPRESICFHCQQYVEKLLKALLTRQGIEAQNRTTCGVSCNWPYPKHQNSCRWSHRLMY